MNTVMVTGDGCRHCVMLKTMLHHMGLGDNVTEVDATSEQGSELMGAFGIRSIPALFKVNNDGKATAFLLGVNHTDETLTTFIKGDDNG